MIHESDGPAESFADLLAQTLATGTVPGPAPSPAPPDVAGFQAMLQAHDKVRGHAYFGGNPAPTEGERALAQALPGALFDALAARGVASALIGYTGGGKDTDFYLNAYPDNAYPDAAQDLVDIVLQYAEACVTGAYPRWYRDEGGEGDVEFDVPARTVRIDHRWYVTTTESAGTVILGPPSFEPTFTEAA